MSRCHLREWVQVLHGEFPVTMSPNGWTRSLTFWGNHPPTETAQSAAKEVATHATELYFFAKHAKINHFFAPTHASNATTLWLITNNKQLDSLKLVLALYLYLYIYHPPLCAHLHAVYLHVHSCLRVFMYTCMCVCVYMHKYVHCIIIII